MYWLQYAVKLLYILLYRNVQKPTQVLTAGSLRDPCSQRLLKSRPMRDKHHFTCPLCPQHLGPRRPPTVIVSCETIGVGRGHLAHCQSTISAHWKSSWVANLIRQELSLAVLPLPSIPHGPILSLPTTPETHSQQI